MIGLLRMPHLCGISRREEGIKQRVPRERIWPGGKNNTGTEPWNF